jgi:predicted ATPase
MNHRPLVVITGGPGSGKSTLIAALRDLGHRTMPEAGRAIIQDQRAIDGPGRPDRDNDLFCELMLGADLRSYREASNPDPAADPAPVFFDRGIPDTIGYLRMLGRPVPAHLDAAAAAFRYHPTVFIAPHWPAIYAHDVERRQSLGEAKRTYRAMAAVYPDQGYRLVELPRASVAARIRHIRDVLAMDAMPLGIDTAIQRHRDT